MAILAYSATHHESTFVHFDFSTMHRHEPYFILVASSDDYRSLLYLQCRLLTFPLNWRCSSKNYELIDIIKINICSPNFVFFVQGCIGLTTPDKGVSDMTSIPDIDETGINRNLKVRYERDEIYVSIIVDGLKFSMLWMSLPFKKSFKI